MDVYTLVGKSGTGKSFHAMNLCKKLNIEGIIEKIIYKTRDRFKSIPSFHLYHFLY